MVGEGGYDEELVFAGASDEAAAAQHCAAKVAAAAAAAEEERMPCYLAATWATLVSMLFHTGKAVAWIPPALTPM